MQVFTCRWMNTTLPRSLHVPPCRSTWSIRNIWRKRMPRIALVAKTCPLLPNVNTTNEATTTMRSEMMNLFSCGSHSIKKRMKKSDGLRFIDILSSSFSFNFSTCVCFYGIKVSSTLTYFHSIEAKHLCINLNEFITIFSSPSKFLHITCVRTHL